MVNSDDHGGAYLITDAEQKQYDGPVKKRWYTHPCVVREDERRLASSPS